MTITSGKIKRFLGAWTFLIWSVGTMLIHQRLGEDINNLSLLWTIVILVNFVLIAINIFAIIPAFVYLFLALGVEFLHDDCDCGRNIVGNTYIQAIFAGSIITYKCLKNE